jgi:hypothetical protein
MKPTAKSQKKLSNRSLVVVAVSCEPTRLADFLSAKEIQRILNQVEQSSCLDGYRISEWAICGYSAGARRVVELGVELGLRKILTWALVPFPIWKLVRSSDCILSKAATTLWFRK